MAETPFWTIRLDTETRALMRQAAKARGQTVTEWAKRAVLAEARRTLTQVEAAATREARRAGGGG